MKLNIFLFFAFVTLAPSPVFSQDFSHVVIFGDSLSDDGNIPKRYNVDFPQAPYWMGRFSNGPTYAEDFPRILGIPQDKTFNYAVGGARTNHKNSVYQSWASGRTPPPPKNYQNLKNTGVMTQIDTYIKNPQTPSGKSTLFTIFAGPNNYLDLGRVQPVSLIGFLKEANKLTSQAADDLYKNAHTLIENKQASWLVMPNMPNLGLTPGARQKGSRVMEGGFVLTKLHNQKLSERAEKLTKNHDVNIYVVDFYTLFNDIIDNPQKYGIVNTREACIDNNICKNTPSVQDKYLFFDPIHPTRVIHKVAAGFLVNTLHAPRQAIAQAYYATQAALFFDRKLLSFMHPSSASSERTLSVTGDFSRTHGDYSNSSVAVNFEYTREFLNMAVVKNFNPHFMATAALGLSNGRAKTLHHRGKFTGKTFHIGAGAEGRIRFFALKAAASFALSEHDMKRSLLTESGTVHAKPKGKSMTASVESRLLFRWRQLHLEPLVRFRTAHIVMDAYREEGSLMGAASLSKIKISPQNLELGGQISVIFNRLNLRGEAVWITGLNNKLRLVKTSSVATPALRHSFMTNIADLAYGRVEGSLGYSFSPNLTVEVGGESIFSNFEGNNWSAFARLRTVF